MIIIASIFITYLSAYLIMAIGFESIQRNSVFVISNLIYSGFLFLLASSLVIVITLLILYQRPQPPNPKEKANNNDKAANPIPRVCRAERHNINKPTNENHRR